MCRMIVIDPMHNLFLGKFSRVPLTAIDILIALIGLAKSHFYHIWVQLKILRKTKELHELHSILDNVRLTLVHLWCGT